MAYFMVIKVREGSNPLYSVETTEDSAVAYYWLAADTNNFFPNYKGFSNSVPSLTAGPDLPATVQAIATFLKPDGTYDIQTITKTSEEMQAEAYRIGTSDITVYAPAPGGEENYAVDFVFDLAASKSLYLGSSPISKLQLGSTQINKIYLGTVPVMQDAIIYTNPIEQTIGTTCGITFKSGTKIYKSTDKSQVTLAEDITIADMATASSGTTTSGINWSYDPGGYSPNEHASRYLCGSFSDDNTLVFTTTGGLWASNINYPLVLFQIYNNVYLVWNVLT